jgi:hypothetical protein
MFKSFNFTYESYSHFIKYAKNIAPIVSLNEFNCLNYKTGIILRHDVDIDILPAYKLAKIESNIGIRSTFFVLTTAHTYNPLSPTNRRLLNEIKKDGFEIGLHFDPTVYGDISHAEMFDKVRFECKILEDIIGEPIKSLSLHNPSIHGKYPVFDEYYNAYSPDIFSDSVYMSDSCMNFRGKNPYEFVKRAKEMPIQMVFHPIHWSEENSSYIDIFRDYTHGIVDYMDEYFRLNQKYKDTIKDEKLWDVLLENKN